MHRAKRPFLIVTFLLLISSCGAVINAAPPGMIALSLDGRSIEGAPLQWDRQEVHLLGRDGWLWSFNPREARDPRKTGDRFRSYTISELRGELLRELGGRFEVSGTSHYLVAHPAGKRDLWAGRFEELYRSFVHYFARRGFQLDEPRFPLIGIVCHDQREFVMHAAKGGVAASGGMLGYYSPETNRIVVFDMGTRSVDDQQWANNASVVIHEATHQTAFNTGIHSRYTLPPYWVAEGLATLFEAPGVYNSRYYTNRSDRINRMRLADFKQIVEPNHRPELITSLVASDELFRTATPIAYAESWALAFYFMETQPQKFARYLGRTAERPMFTDYTARQRVADFVAVFGDNWELIESHFLRFMDGID